MPPNRQTDSLSLDDEKENIIETKNTLVSSEDPVNDTEIYQLSDKGGVNINASEADSDSIVKDVDFEYPEDEVEVGEIPTQEEMETLRHVGGRIPFRCWLIATVELAERFSYYGLSAPFQNYMSNGPNDTPKGLLQLNSSGATGLSYFFQFWCESECIIWTARKGCFGDDSPA